MSTTRDVKWFFYLSSNKKRKALVKKSLPAERFLVCMADHIFDPSLVARMGNVPFGDRKGALCGSGVVSDLA